MNLNFKRYMAAPLLLAAMAVLGGCGNVSRDVAKDGGSASEMVWPAPDHAEPMRKGGTFPDPAVFGRITPGLTKQQVANVIGYPHFNEGIAGVREWNYLFNFRQADDKVTVCQFKVLFDENKIARSFYWEPEACADIVKPKAAAPGEVARKEPVTKTFTLSADALFAFNKSGTNDIRKEGRDELDALSIKLMSVPGTSHIHVLGYTDRLGSDSYNLNLSEQRANTVVKYLLQHGLSMNAIAADGRGSADPVTECNESDRQALIACLAPNRRVEVKVEGSM